MDQKEFPSVIKILCLFIGGFLSIVLGCSGWLITCIGLDSNRETLVTHGFIMTMTAIIPWDIYLWWKYVIPRKNERKE